MARKKNGGSSHSEAPPQATETAPPPAAVPTPPPPGGNRPAREIRLGRIRATMWRNHHSEQGTWFSVTFSRSYKDKEGQWKNATSYGMDDLLVLAEIARMAFHWIHEERLKPQESKPSEVTAHPGEPIHD